MATTIKIDRELLIATLTAKVKEMEKNNAQYDKDHKAYEAAKEKWEQECVKTAVKNIKTCEVSVNAWHYHNSSVNISVPNGLFPPQPEFDTDVAHTPDYELREIRQFIRMLEMSTADSINMSALKNMSQYL